MVGARLLRWGGESDALLPLAQADRQRPARCHRCQRAGVPAHRRPPALPRGRRARVWPARHRARGRVADPQGRVRGPGAGGLAARGRTGSTCCTTRRSTRPISPACVAAAGPTAWPSGSRGSPPCRRPSAARTARWSPPSACRGRSTGSRVPRSRTSRLSSTPQHGCPVAVRLPATQEADLALNADDRDPSIDPGDDFYRFANGGWLDANPIPPGYGAWGAFHEVDHHNREILHALLERAARSPQTDLDRLIGDYFAAGMDTRGDRGRRARPRPALPRPHPVPGHPRRCAGAPPPPASRRAARPVGLGSRGRPRRFARAPALARAGRPRTARSRRLRRPVGHGCRPPRGVRRPHRRAAARRGPGRCRERR